MQTFLFLSRDTLLHDNYLYDGIKNHQIMWQEVDIQSFETLSPPQNSPNRLMNLSLNYFHDDIKKQKILRLEVHVQSVKY